jgi:hypothetical protein
MLSACGGEGDEAPDNRTIEVQVVDERGTPLGNVFVAVYDSDYAQFFFQPDYTGQTDSRGIATLELPATGTYWFEAVDASHMPTLSSVSSGAAVIGRDVESSSFFQIVVRPFESGPANLAGKWRYEALNEGVETMNFAPDLKYELRWADGEAETGQCVFKESGWIQGYLTCSPSDGFLPREYFVTALTRRYLGLEWSGTFALYEKEGLEDPNVTTPPRGTGGAGGTSSVDPGTPPLGTGGTFDVGTGPGAPDSVALVCSEPRAGYGRSCASDRDCGCSAPVCLPVLHYCSKLDCSGDFDCPTGFSCAQLTSTAMGTRSLCVEAEPTSPE